MKSFLFRWALASLNNCVNPLLYAKVGWRQDDGDHCDDDDGDDGDDDDGEDGGDGDHGDDYNDDGNVDDDGQHPFRYAEAGKR